MSEKDFGYFGGDQTRLLKRSFEIYNDFTPSGEKYLFAEVDNDHNIWDAWK